MSPLVTQNLIALITRHLDIIPILTWYHIYMLFTSYLQGKRNLSLRLGVPDTTWVISSSGASNPGPKEHFPRKREPNIKKTSNLEKYGARCIRYIWNMLDLVFQSAPLLKFFGIWGSTIYCSLYPEKGSLGPGLDAPKLEMPQVVLGTLNQEL